MLVHSLTTGKDYNPRKSCRVGNPLQIAVYLKLHAELLDIYDSIDRFTGQPCVVAIFDKEATSEIYEKWKERDW